VKQQKYNTNHNRAYATAADLTKTTLPTTSDNRGKFKSFKVDAGIRVSSLTLPLCSEAPDSPIHRASAG